MEKNNFKQRDFMNKNFLLYLLLLLLLSSNIAECSDWIPYQHTQVVTTVNSNVYTPQYPTFVYPPQPYIIHNPVLNYVYQPIVTERRGLFCRTYQTIYTPTFF